MWTAPCTLSCCKLSACPSCLGIFSAWARWLGAWSNVPWANPCIQPTWWIWACHFSNSWGQGLARKRPGENRSVCLCSSCGLTLLSMCRSQCRCWFCWSAAWQRSPNCGHSYIKCICHGLCVQEALKPWPLRFVWWAVRSWAPARWAYHHGTTTSKFSPSCWAKTWSCCTSRSRLRWRHTLAKNPGSRLAKEISRTAGPWCLRCQALWSSPGQIYAEPAYRSDSRDSHAH